VELETDGIELKVTIFMETMESYLKNCSCSPGQEIPQCYGNPPPPNRVHKTSVVDPILKMDLWEIGFRDVDWIHLAQDRDRWRALENTVMTLRVP
jgi:hypothetical protein